MPRSLKHNRLTVLESPMPAPRRFAPPWTLDVANNACFIVRDHNGQALAYVYFEDEPGRHKRRYRKAFKASP